MSSQHFVVAAQDRAWHYSYKGDIIGPYTSREEAVAAAIEEASNLDDDDVEVVVRDADLRTETVWRPNQPKP
ncbi:MAG TPA: hypothetical protein VIL88_17575 [Devosia sp.]|jgi:hypothetical protein|uniref:hypothetical protein n=1 Tax=Devosia sp. TaxID=1871048 RepID=UPI002F931ED1